MAGDRLIHDRNGLDESAVLAKANPTASTAVGPVGPAKGGTSGFPDRGLTLHAMDGPPYPRPPQCGRTRTLTAARPGGPTLHRGLTPLRVALLITGTLVLWAATPERPADQPDPDLDRIAKHTAAFTRLHGYVRFFHPSDEAAGIDWERFVVHGMDRVLETRDEDELASVLGELFLPIAPTLKITHGGHPQTLEPTPPGAEAEVVAWQHHGIGLSSWTLYSSTRVNRPGMLGGSDLTRIIQEVPAVAVRGRHVRLRARVRAEVEQGMGNARLTLTAMGAGGPAFSDEMEDRPITDPEWREYEVRGRIPDHATGALVGGAFWGSGRAWFDAFELAVSGDGEIWTEVPLQNPGFEAGADEGLAGWIPMTPNPQSLAVTPDPENAFRGATSVRVEVNEPDRLFATHPDLGEAVDAPIGAGLRVHLPIALASVDQRTLPPAGPERLIRLEAELAEVDLDARGLGDRALRLANVATAWAVFQHFFPYHEEIEAEWEVLLEPTLREAAAADSDLAYLQALQRLVAALEDGHGSVSHPSLVAEASLPVRVGWVEEKVVVTAASDGSPFRPGDIVVALDGVAAEQVLAETMQLRSGSPGYRQHLALRAFGRGTAGEEVELLVRRGDDERVHRVQREPGPPPEEATLDPITEVADGIYYVDLRRAGMATIEPRLEELSAARGVVFDVRGYPQGDAHLVLYHLADEPVQWAKMCIPLTIHPDRSPQPDCPLSAGGVQQPRAPRFQGEAVFLTNTAAMSYGETFMGIVSHYELGAIVGEPTGGVNGNQNWMYLPGEIRINWTGMRVVRHDGSRHYGVGHPPTLPVEPTLEGVKEGRDELLDRAVELVGGTLNR